MTWLMRRHVDFVPPANQRCRRLAAKDQVRVPIVSAECVLAIPQRPPQ